MEMDQSSEVKLEQDVVSPKINHINLKPNRDLLYPNFDKYILSTDTIPIVKQNLEQTVHISEPSSSQYSRNNMKLFSLASSIVHDPFHSTKELTSFVYFVKNFSFNRISYNHNTHKFDNINVIELDSGLEYIKEQFSGTSLPLSIVFGSNEYVFIANGISKVMIYKIETHESKEIWSLVKMIGNNTVEFCDESEYKASHNVGKFSDAAGFINIGKPFIIGDVRKGIESSFEIALLANKKLEESERKASGIFANDIYWVSVNISSEGCILTRSRIFRCNGNLEFVTLSSDGQELILSAAKIPKLVFDSEGMTTRSEDTMPMDDGNEEVPEKPEIKSEKMDGVEPAIASINPEQLEEVDEEGDEQNFLFWISSKETLVIRMANLSSHKILFVKQFNENKPVDICVREDVDGIVYSLDTIENDRLEHRMTFDAFGYIQAGKSSRKFTTCAPDGSYCAIIDGRNYAYVYLKSSAILSTQLRNTKTRKDIQAVARQYVISLPSEDMEYRENNRNQNIIFAFGHEKILFLATDWSIYACHIV